MITEEMKTGFKSLLDHFGKEDEAVRFRQIRQWRKLKLYWDGLQRIWYSEVAHDWRVWDDINSQGDDQSVYYDKPINVFRAYLESIIAALSINIPAITCFPEDATNPDDIRTAKAGDKIARLIYRHNEAILFWLHSLYIYSTEGLIGCYSYSKEDEKFGTYKEDKFETTEEERLVCPNCEEILPDNLQPVMDEMTGEESINCPECNEPIDPNLQAQKTEVKRLIGTITKPKSRQCLEVYGGLYIKVPNYAMKQSDCPYLIWEYETHYSNVIARYPELAKKFQGQPQGLTGSTDPYERWGRQPTPYITEEARNVVTVRNCWFRPSSYFVLDTEKCDDLKKRYPKGLKVVYANDEFCEASDESMDDCWTLSKNPLSDYIHHDPMGSLLVSIQDITNDMISLILQTIEHGIPQTFADPNTLDFDAYQNSESTPGMVYPMKPQPAGSDANKAFVTLKTASLSPEVMPFSKTVQDLGQLVSGALPSLFGGPSQQGSKTASEYAMSRAQALQRLQTPWKTLTIWWKEIFEKVIPAYMADMVDDEKFVEKNADGAFVNIVIEKAQLEGKIGRIELEGSENVPITMQQKKDVLLNLMQFADPSLLSALSAPENIPFVKEALGLDEIVVPGEDDRQKQYEEIQLLLETEPMPSMDAMGMPSMQPSVQVDSILDNHQIEASICRSWLISDVGRNAKITNPSGYENVLLHMKEHMQMIQIQMQQSQMQANQDGSEKKPAQNNPDNNEPQISEEDDVTAPIH
jgi:hypothetical protein